MTRTSPHKSLPGPALRPGKAAGPLRRFWLPVAVLMAVHTALGIGAARRLTTTHDEYWHLPVGLLNLNTGRFHFDNLNPPLCRMAAAIPLALARSARIGPADAQHDPMGWGDVFVAQNRERYAAWFAMGRSVIVLISVAGGLVTAIWARELFGDKAGCLAALLWAMEPNLVAHGSLVTTDMGAAAFFVFALFATWKFAARPGWTRAIVLGVVLGLAQAVKFTSIILYPLAIAEFVIGWLAFRNTAEADPQAVSRSVASQSVADLSSPRLNTRLFWQGLTAFLVSLLVLNAAYLFRGSLTPLRSYTFHSSALNGLADRWPAIGSIPVPLPRDYLEGLDHQRQIMEQKHPVFLDGTWSEQGFPHYYLWALFYKLPHPLQLLTVATLIWLVVPGDKSRRLLVQAGLLAPALVMLGVAEGSGMQLGIRYVLPVLPFVILFASQSAQWLSLKAFPVRTAMVIGLAAWMIFSVRYHPNHLAYFNELAGGPLGGREHLLDSNLDWGQDLGGLKQYLTQQGIREIGLAYFGTVPPASLGIDYQIPPSQTPRPGLYAVSVNFEQGRPHWVRTPQGEIRPVDINQFAYFSFFHPIARIGYSIDIFQLSEADLREKGVD